AVVQIAASFVLLAGASMLLKTLIAMQTARTGLDTRHVLAINVPVMNDQITTQQVVDFYKETIRRIDAMPGVMKTAFGVAAPWRDGGFDGPGLQFSADGHVHSPENDPRAHFRTISPGFFAALGVPILGGRDFNDLDTQSKEPVVIVSETLANRMFPARMPSAAMFIGPTPCCNSFLGLSQSTSVLLALPAILTMKMSFPSPLSRFTAPLTMAPCLTAVCLFTRAQIPIRWSRRSRS